MSLFTLSTAVAGIRAGKHSLDSKASDATEDINEATVHLQLQQMTAAVDACNRSRAQNRHQSSVPDPLKAVQDALQITRQQLQRLLQQQQQEPSLMAAQQYTPQQTHAQQQQHGHHPHNISSSWAELVLQDLLQLAVGDVSLLAGASEAAQQHSAINIACCCSSKTDIYSSKPRSAPITVAEPCWCPESLHRSAKQQQLWGDAAVQAVRLFHLQDLLAGSSSTLHQALLLRPQLMDQLLEALAAAVLRPVLLNPVPSTQPLSSSTRLMPISTSSSSSSNDSTWDSQCYSITAALANSKLPWPQLPDILAANPPLMMKASGTLLSWLEASGHLQLWHLASLILRPAWQRMAAAATTEAAHLHSSTQLTQAGEPVSSQGLAMPCPALLSSTSAKSGSYQVLAGSFQLVCPEVWQQQLVQQLVQEPSGEGLAKLLQLLPGLSASGSCDGSAIVQQQQQQVRIQDGTSDGVMATEGIQGWPSAEEWSSKWQQQGSQQQQALPAAAADTSKRPRIENPCQQIQHGSDLLSVLAAWRLVVQHRCWYEFACYLLVRGSITILQTQQQQKQQCSGASVTLQYMQCASAFIAWVNQPVDTHKQYQMQQQLLAPANNTAGSFAQAVESVSDKAPAASLIDLCTHLLQCWRQALSGVSVNKLAAVRSRTAAAAAAAEAAAASAEAGDCASAHARRSAGCTGGGTACAGGSTASATSVQCLAAVDLPVAILQQLQLLTQCNQPEELLRMCFPEILLHLQQQLHHQQHMGASAATEATHRQPAEAALQETQQQTLEAVAVDRSVLCAAPTAVDAISSAAVEFNAALKCDTQLVDLQRQTGAQQQQQQQQLHCERWLSRQWVTEVLTDKAFDAHCMVDAHFQDKAAADKSAYIMQVAQKLVQSSTACDKLLKARVMS